MKRGLREKINPIDDACNINNSLINDFKFILSEIKTFINGLITFVKHIPGYYKLYVWYGYDPLVYDSIIFNYEKVLSNRTKRMSKPTYTYSEVMSELDEYYDEIYKTEIETLEKEIDKLEKDNKWILIKDELPEIHEETNSSEVVLVQGYDKDIDYYWQAMCWYSNETKQWYFAECKNTDKLIDWIDVIAWRYLPEDLKIWRKK